MKDGGINFSILMNIWIQHYQKWIITRIRLKWKNIGQIVISREATKVSNLQYLYMSLEEADIRCKLNGDVVESLRPFSEMICQDFFTRE